MPDITMCSNVNCPVREQCYRYRAKPDEHWQSYSDFEPETGADRDWNFVVKCEHFWDATRYPKEVLSTLEEADKRNVVKSATNAIVEAVDKANKKLDNKLEIALNALLEIQQHKQRLCLDDVSDIIMDVFEIVDTALTKLKG